MNEDIDAWLNEGLAENVAKATGQPVPQGPPLLHPVELPPPPAQVDPSAKGLAKFGIGKGGTIRNPNTKKVTVTASNQIVSPSKPGKVGMTKTVKAPTPEEDFAAEHPGLAIPSVLSGMDVDTQKRNGHQTTAPVQPAPVAAGQPVPVSYQSTLRDLLNLAVASGGTLHFGTGEFVLSIQILKAPG